MATDWKDMADNDFIHEALRFLPLLQDLLRRIETQPEEKPEPAPEPRKPSCNFCGGSGTVGMGTLCTHCEAGKVKPVGERTDN